MCCSPRSRNSPAPWCSSPTTAISSTSWPRAFSKWKTAASRFFPATTRTTSGGNPAARRPLARQAHRRLQGRRTRPQRRPSRRSEIEVDVARLEAEIAEAEAALGNFVSVEETTRLTELVAARQAGLAALLEEWEQVAQIIEVNS